MTKEYYIFVKSYRHPKTGKIMPASRILMPHQLETRRRRHCH